MTAPCRLPPYSAGMAPVKISSESMFFGSMISAKFELVASGIGAPSISYVTPWKPWATGSLYEKRTIPGTVVTS